MIRADEIEARAARWLLRREEGPWSESDQAALDAWLAEDDRHTTTFWRLEYGWEKAGRMAALRGAAPPQHRNPGWTGWYLVGPLVAGLLLTITIFIGEFHDRQVYATAVGGHRIAPLRDGSRLELNTATRVRVAVDDTTRAVWLDRGEAYFEVAHDAKHPFVVYAGARTITVLGTKFSVRRDGDRVDVAVVEGRVKVEDTRSGASLGKTAPPVLVVRGDMMIADGASNLLSPPSPQRVANALSWRQGRLTFDQATLADAAAEFNRYNRKRIVVADANVAAMRIGGSFEATNVDAFTHLIGAGFGLKIEDDGQTVRISE